MRKMNFSERKMNFSERKLYWTERSGSFSWWPSHSPSLGTFSWPSQKSPPVTHLKWGSRFRSQIKTVDLPLGRAVTLSRILTTVLLDQDEDQDDPHPISWTASSPSSNCFSNIATTAFYHVHQQLLMYETVPCFHPRIPHERHSLLQRNNFNNAKQYNVYHQRTYCEKKKVVQNSSNI